MQPIRKELSTRITLKSDSQLFTIQTHPHTLPRLGECGLHVAQFTFLLVVFLDHRCARSGLGVRIGLSHRATIDDSGADRAALLPLGQYGLRQACTWVPSPQVTVTAPLSPTFGQLPRASKVSVSPPIRLHNTWRCPPRPNAAFRHTEFSCLIRFPRSFFA